MHLQVCVPNDDVRFLMRGDLASVAENVEVLHPVGIVAVGGKHAILIDERGSDPDSSCI